MKNIGFARDGGIIAVLLIAVGLLAGCGGNNATPAIPADTGTEPAETGVVLTGIEGLPAVPVDGHVDPAEIIARRGSVLEDQLLAGNETFLIGPEVTCDPEGGSAALDPDGDTLAWAMYRFTDLLASDTGLQIALNLESPLPGSLYLGISDYGRNCWDWTGTSTPLAPFNLDVPEGSSLISDGGCLYAVVACRGPESAQLLGARLYRDTLAPSPQGLTASQGVSPTTISLAWDDPETTHPALVSEGIVVERRPGGGDWLEIAGLAAGINSYEDINGTGNEFDYGQEYEYRVRMIVDGVPGRPCDPVTGYRRLPDVTSVSATEDAYPDSIRVSWDRIEEADGYQIEILFNDAWQPVTELDSGNNYFYRHYWDETPGVELDFNTDYEYRVRAVWREYYSEAWTGDTGRRGLAPATNITATDGTYPDRVELSWDLVSYCTGYQVEYSTGGGEIGVLATLDGFAHDAFTHSHAAPVGHECELDTEYSYWIRPLYGAEIMPRDTDNFDTGFRRVQPPQGTTATDGTTHEHVLVTWETPVDISEIEIYRDGTDPGNLIATVGAVGEYTDAVPDFDEHTYYMVSVWQGIRSEPDTPDTGYRNLFIKSQVSGDDSAWIDLAMVDGRPAITASRPVERGVWFYQAADTAPVQPADWQSHRILDCEAGSTSRIAEFSGRPAVLVAESRDDYTNSVTYSYAAVSDPVVDMDWATQLITDQATQRMDAVLASINGAPALCFNDSSGYYYLSATADPPVDIADWEESKLMQHCFYPSLVEYDGVPVLGASSSSSLQFVGELNVFIGQTATPASSGWYTHARGQGCVSNTVAVVGGRLAGACRNTYGKLTYSRALTDIPASWSDWSSHEIDDCREIRGSGFMIDSGGFPAVAYTTNTDEGIFLKVAIGTTSTPDSSADWAIRRVVLAPDISRWVIAEVDGRLALAYLRSDDGDNHHIYYAAAVE